jgi:uncharacterized membrane protein
MMSRDVSNERRREDPADDEINVGQTERLISGAAAAVLGLVALRKRRLRRLLLPLAGGLASRALTGRCAVNRALGRNTARADLMGRGGRSRRRGIKVDQSTTINRPRQEVFAFWRNFENLPRFMDHLESVRVLDEDRSYWVAKGPAGTRVEWEAEIHEELPERLIAWRSLEGADVDHEGSVRFIAAGDDATEVRVVLRYDPPAGRAGAAVARLFGEDPASQVAEDLRRFKQVLEAGEVPTQSRS